MREIPRSVFVEKQTPPNSLVDTERSKIIGASSGLHLEEGGNAEEGPSGALGVPLILLVIFSS